MNEGRPDVGNQTSGRPSSVQADVIGFLSRPESHGGTEPVERIDTHVAMVFLAGDRALKLKRAVRFPYLDFTTVALRHQALEQELRLNRRTAPELYLRLRSIGRNPDGSLGFDAGEPVDWILEMHRFDQACLLSAVAARGALTMPIIHDLADAVAAFHAEARPTPGHGGAAAMRAIIDENHQSMAEGLPADDVARFHARSLEALAGIAGTLDRRRDQGKVRHCHGDLHLRNIALIGGKPVLFDCLEFSEELASIDVLYDLAFLLMDLWHRGEREAANRLFNRYLDRSDEADGLCCLPLFLSMRAAVRAHVAVSAGKPAEGRAYLDRALELLRPVTPRLAAVGGLSGTGKSTLAYRIAPELGRPPGARVVRSDVLRKRLMGVAPEVRLGPEGYVQSVTEATYDGLGAACLQAIAQGQAAIADAVFQRADEREEIGRLAATAGVRFDGLWLTADRAVLRARIEARRGDASDADVAVLEAQLARDVGPLGNWHTLDAAPGIDSLVKVAMGHL